MEIPKRLRRHWRQLARKRLIQEASSKTPPPRSHYKIIMKWAKKHGLTYLSGQMGRSSIYRGNDWFAYVYYMDRGRHVVRSVVLSPEADPWVDSVKTRTIKDAIEVLNGALHLAKHPELAPKESPRRIMERRKFKPLRGAKRESHLDRS